MRTKNCAVCGTRKHLEEHHVKYQSMGGSDEDSNKVTVCASCHGIIHQMSVDYGEIKTRKHRDSMDQLVEQRKFKSKMSEESEKVAQSFCYCGEMVFSLCYWMGT